MNDANGIKHTILAVMAAVGAALEAAMGGWDGVLKMLVAMMVVDYLTGLAVAAVWHRSPKSTSGALDSRAGFKGICRKGAALLVVWVAAMLDKSMGVGYVRTAVCLFFIGNEGLSMLENLGLMGVPFPAFLQRALEALREKGDGGDGAA